MSHYSDISVNFTNAESLVAALIAAGVDRAKIECHKEPQQIFDYRGNPTKYQMAEGDKCHVIIRRKDLPTLHNDLGFTLSDKGSKAFICDFARDRSGFNDKWLNKVRDEYAALESTKHYAKLGKKAYRKQGADGAVYLFVKG